MYASIGSTAAVTLAAALIPPANVFFQAARVCLAAAGLVFAAYTLVLLAVAVRATFAP